MSADKATNKFGRPRARRQLARSDDKHTGLYYNHNRYYNPKLGRYVEADPIGLEGGLNPYVYAGNDPVNNVDVSGLLYGLSDGALSASAPINSNNFIMAMPMLQIDVRRYDWDKPNYNNMRITRYQRDLANEGDYKGLYVNRWEVNQDPVARTSAIGWDAATDSMNVQGWERAAAAVTWASMKSYLIFHGYPSGQQADNQMSVIGRTIAREYVKAVDTDTSGVIGLLNPQQIGNYHYAAFEQHGIPPGLFGGAMGWWRNNPNAYSGIWCRYCDTR